MRRMASRTYVLRLNLRRGADLVVVGAGVGACVVVGEGVGVLRRRVVVGAGVAGGAELALAVWMRLGAGTAPGGELGVGVAGVPTVGAGVLGALAGVAVLEVGPEVAKVPPAWLVSAAALRPSAARLPLLGVPVGVLACVPALPVLPPAVPAAMNQSDQLPLWMRHAGIRTHELHPALTWVLMAKAASRAPAAGVVGALVGGASVGAGVVAGGLACVGADVVGDGVAGAGVAGAGVAGAGVAGAGVAGADVAGAEVAGAEVAGGEVLPELPPLPSSVPPDEGAGVPGAGVLPVLPVLPGVPPELPVPPGVPPVLPPLLAPACRLEWISP